MSGWYYRWPDQRVVGPRRFGEVWARLAAGFERDATELHATTVRYEDLVAGPGSIDELEKHLGLPINRSALAEQSSGSAGPGAMSETDRRLLRRAVEPVAERLGYQPS